MITVERYAPRMAGEWNALVAASRNATFMHDRRYMDYHADRFDDFSLVARDGKGRALALLPACRKGDTLSSHAGLSYGGWLLPDRRCDALDMLEIWDAMTVLLRASGVKELIYKPSPHIYHRRPAEEDLYALARAGGQIASTLVSSVIDLDDPLPMDQGSRQRVRKALADPSIVIGESDRWADFHGVLTRLLASRYGAVPVHSLAELTMLHDRFPENIRLYTATDRESGEVLAGVVLYVSQTVAHSQYTAAAPRGKELSVVPGIYSHIISRWQGRVRWLDFGTSNEDGGREVNAGLLRQKCSYGGRAVAYTTYRLNL